MRMEQKNSTDHFFRSNLRNHGITPSKEAWQRLEKSLDTKKKVRFYRHQKIGWMLVALGFIGLSIWYSSDKGSTPIPQVRSTLVNPLENNIANHHHDEMKLEVESTNTKPQVKHQVIKLERKTKDSSLQLSSALKTSQKKKIHRPIRQKLTDNKSEMLKNQIDKKSTSDTLIAQSNTDSAVSGKVIQKIKPVPRITKEAHKVEIIIKMGTQPSSRGADRTSIEKKDTTEEVAPTQPTSRLRRVIKQVRNFKQGNKVDFNQLKRNPAP